MNEDGGLRREFERRWNHIGPVYINALVFSVVSFRARLFHSGGWHYPMEFVVWAAVMLLLLSRLRFAYRPTHHASLQEFRRLQFRSGLLVALPMAAYVSFFEYSAREVNLFGLSVVGCSTFLTSVVSALTVRNPPFVQPNDSPLLARRICS